MARRTAKSPAPLQNIPTFNVFPELPGAVFIGDVNDDDLRYAKLLQAARQAYESSDCQAALWHALTEIGLGYDEIERAVLNPATLTACVYGVPLGGISPGEAIVAKSLMVERNAIFC
jgi:hypothetical protein